MIEYPDMAAYSAGTVFIGALEDSEVGCVGRWEFRIMNANIG